MRKVLLPLYSAPVRLTMVFQVWASPFKKGMGTGAGLVKPNQKSKGVETLQTQEQPEKLTMFSLEKGRFRRHLHEGTLQLLEMMPCGPCRTELCCRASCLSNTERALSSEQNVLPRERRGLGAEHAGITRGWRRVASIQTRCFLQDL